MRIYNSKSQVEKLGLEQSGRKFCYSPTEKLGVIEVLNFSELGKITALRFLEWLQLNPEGVVALPTGRTPQSFIEWTIYYLKNWGRGEVQKELENWGINPANKPDMKSFYFVQLDEYFPINPEDKKSYAYFIEQNYIKGFGFDKSKALLMDAWILNCGPDEKFGDIFVGGKVDLDLRMRKPRNKEEEIQLRAIVAVDQFILDYESKIQELGGIGFFLGGIGPDGHIAFNTRGSSHSSRTRLLRINYETAVGIAGTFGGIEHARDKVAMTIGLATITQNSSATAIIIAAGQSKSVVVKNAIENESSTLYPATALQKLKGARFYITKEVATFLTERKVADLKKLQLFESVTIQILVDLAKDKNKRILDLDEQDLKTNKFGELLLQKTTDLKAVINKVVSTLIDRIKVGLQQFNNKKILHTSPHHDDVMLGYLPFIEQLVDKTSSKHHFATMTSGFRSVTDFYFSSQLAILENFLEQNTVELDDSGGAQVALYLKGLKSDDLKIQNEAVAKRLLQNFSQVFKTQDLNALKQKIQDIKRGLLIEDVQKLKGMIREWEEEILWAHLGFSCKDISHLRLCLYFETCLQRDADVEIVCSLFEKLDPDIITVVVDPHGIGPDTHYKVLQVAKLALEKYLERNPGKTPSILGYRNVWFRFHPAEANMFIPVSLDLLESMKTKFNISYGSQKKVSFPSVEYDGPFGDLSAKIMMEQYETLKTCLGEDFFKHNENQILREARGFCFLKMMTPEQFLTLF